MHGTRSPARSRCACSVRSARFPLSKICAHGAGGRRVVLYARKGEWRTVEMQSNTDCCILRTRKWTVREGVWIWGCAGGSVRTKATEPRPRRPVSGTGGLGGCSRTGGLGGGSARGPGHNTPLCVRGTRRVSQWVECVCVWLEWVNAFTPRG